jgi:hypothetical protein
MVSYDNAIVNWCRGKSWLARLPVIIFLIYIFIMHLNNPMYRGFLDMFDLLMHEAGHWIFIFFGETMHILGGTLMQLLVPLVCLLAFWKQSDYSGVTFSLGWVGNNLFDVATYIGDARARVLPLLGGDSSGHDWYNLLSRWNLLPYDKVISEMVKFTGVILMTVSIVFGIWLVWLMYINKKSVKH